MTIQEAKEYVEESRQLSESQYDDLKNFEREIQKWINLSEQKK